MSRLRVAGGSCAFVTFAMGLVIACGGDAASVGEATADAAADGATPGGDGSVGPGPGPGPRDGSTPGPNIDGGSTPVVDGGAPVVDASGPPPTFASATLSAGGSTACAIMADGALRCWGGSTSASASQTVTPGTAYSVVSVGSSQTCAVRKADQLLYCWASSTFTPTARDTGTFLQVSSGGQHQCAIASSGAMYCWGGNSGGALGTGDTTYQANLTPVIGGATDWARVTTGALHTCALKTSGALYCWGYNALGQVGDNGGSSADAGVGAHHTAPVPILPGVQWVDVSAGANGTCGVDTSGALKCWGSVGSRNDKVPTSIDTASDWARVSVGASHACALKKDGRLFCWGQNPAGELGNGSTAFAQSPSQVGVDGDWVDVAAGTGFTCGTKSSGTYCWGTNGQGQLGTGTANHLAPTKIGAGADWKYVATTTSTTCGVKKSGELACWGIVPGLQLETRRQVPYTIGGETWAAVTLAPGRGCARKDDGSLSCWGNGYQGELGIGNNVSFAALPSSTGQKASMVSMGAEHTCSIDPATSLLWCWGEGIFSKTLVADTDVPLQAGTDPWKEIAAEGRSSCGIRANGELWCFGFGYSTPEHVGLATAVDWQGLSVWSASRAPFFALRGGTIYRWTYSDDPAAVGAETTWRAVSAGSGHQCAIRANNSLACMGNNFQGQLGDGTTTARGTFTNIGLASDWQMVAAGDTHTCGIRNDGELYCWGDNTQGQIGDGSAFSTTPVGVQ